jgi:hypothetical protein
MMPFDYSTPPPQTALNLIPAKTIIPVIMTIKPGDSGEDGWLTQSKSGECQMLAFSLTGLSGQHAKRKIFGQLIVEGAEEKYGELIWRSRKLLKRILDSAFNLDPNDKSAEAKAKLNVGYDAFDNLKFYARIGIDVGNGDWPAKNTLTGTVTRNEPEWPGPVEQDPRENGEAPQPPVSSTPAIARPAWAE